MLFIALVRGFIKYLIPDPVRQILLRHIVAWIIMGKQISRASSKFLVPVIMGIPQVCRYRKVSGLPKLFPGPEICGIGCI